MDSIDFWHCWVVHVFEGIEGVRSIESGNVCIEYTKTIGFLIVDPATLALVQILECEWAGLGCWRFTGIGYALISSSVFFQACYVLVGPLSIKKGFFNDRKLIKTLITFQDIISACLGRGEGYKEEPKRLGVEASRNSLKPNFEVTLRVFRNAQTVAPSGLKCVS